MRGRIRNLGDVVRWGLCTGCGACHYACRKSGISLVNLAQDGIRPRFDLPECATCVECAQTCPGYQVDDRLVARAQPGPVERHEFGTVLEIWEGCATDPDLRFRASSGGVLSALALYCLEREGMESVVHTAMDDGQPWLNRTVQSRDREQLLERTGSRYAPASPCDGLQAIERSDRPCVFIGKPCDSAAVMMLCARRPELARRVGLVLTFFCAGTPSTGGTLALLESMGIDRQQIRRLRYRGEGWPGEFKVSHGPDREQALPYMESWSRLARHRPFRCHLCPDGLGRMADLSCGDAWDRYSDDGNPGRSIVLVRTERGRRLLSDAMQAGYVYLERADARRVTRAQSELLERRRQLFGRLLAMRLLGVPVPRFRGFDLWRAWLSLGPRKQFRSIVGTLRRVIARGMWRPQT